MQVGLAIVMMGFLSSSSELKTGEDASRRANELAATLLPTLKSKPSEFKLVHNVWGDEWTIEDGLAPAGKDANGNEMWIQYHISLDKKTGALRSWSDPLWRATPDSKNPPRDQWAVKTEAQAWEAGRKWLRFAGLARPELKPVPFGSDREFRTGLREDSSGFYHLVFAERMPGVRGAVNEVRVDIAPGTGRPVNIVGHVGFTYSEPKHRITPLQAAQIFRETFTTIRRMVKTDPYYDGKMDWPGDSEIAAGAMLALCPDFERPAYEKGALIDQEGKVKSNRWRLVYELGSGACDGSVDVETGAVLRVGITK